MTHAAEGYLLGDLTAAEYAAFEDHFADCDACFAQVRDGATIVAAARKAEQPARRGLRDYFPTLATAASITVVALSVIGYQQIELARLRAPRVAEIYTLQKMRSADVKTLIDGGAPFTLDFDITADPPSPQGYTCTIVDAQGKDRYRVFVTAERARRPIILPMAAGSLAPGRYSLIVTRADKTQVSQSEFTVMQKERKP